MDSINVFRQRMPGVGQRFDFDLDERHVMSVVALRDGRRQLSLRGKDEDHAVRVMDLDREQAVTLGALLLGAHFAVGLADDDALIDQVVVETITVADNSPAVGQTAREAVSPLGGDVVVLAVIRDQTPEVVEHDPNLALRSGDRVAVAARRNLHQDVDRLLGGAETALGHNQISAHPPGNDPADAS